MTKFLLPAMVDRQTKSAIINVSSVCHFTPMGMLAMYCGTKSYQYMFSKNLALSYPKKIDVLTVTPAGTKSQMYSGRYSFSVDASDHAKSVINQLGWVSETRGHYVHGIQPYMLSIPPIKWYFQSKDKAAREAFVAEQKAKLEAEKKATAK